MKRRMLSILTVLCLLAGVFGCPVYALTGNSQFAEFPFTATAGEVTGVQEEGFQGYTGPVTLYTLTIPAGTESLELTFPGDRIAYAYDFADSPDAEYDVYLYSCAESGEYGSNGQEGEPTAFVRVKEGGEMPDYVVVQTPYTEEWYSETLYAIEFAWEPAFSDIEGHWAEQEIVRAAEEGIFRGTGKEKFSPDMTMSRAMVITALWQMEDSPEAEAAGYIDVPDKAWYAGAVAWAAEQGIVKGYDAKRFGPEDPVTRQQMAVILYRYALSRGWDVPDSGAVPDFADADQVAPWAQAEICWAVDTGLLQGRTGEILAPDGEATRAECAVMMLRLLDRP